MCYTPAEPLALSKAGKISIALRIQSLDLFAHLIAKIINLLHFRGA